MTAGLYEQLKDDLGYLQLGRAAETFATLAETAKREDWSHLQFLARLVGEQAAATRDRRMAARLRYARFPFRRSIDEFDYDFQPSVDRKLVDDLATLRFVDGGRPVLFLGQTRLRQNASRGGVGDHGRGGRVARLLHHRR